MRRHYSILFLTVAFFHSTSMPADRKNMGTKRKSYQARRGKWARGQTLAARRAAVVPGYTRVSGFYGRFNRPKTRSPELKFFDTALAFSLDSTMEAATTAVLGQIDLIPQGVTESTRDGKDATVREVRVRGNLLVTNDNDVGRSFGVHIYLVLDQQTNGAQAAAADIFTGTDVTTNFVNMENTQRFKILAHKQYILNPVVAVVGAASSAIQPMIKQVDITYKGSVPLIFSSTTGALTELRSNHIFLAYGTGGNSADDKVVFAGNSRLRFVG